ncbi:MAG: hemolysin, partial [Rikenellaceae bacterium]|nr:hemolysin [Rikenellaceae bacterium]
MEPIIEPVDRELLEAELTPERIWRKTNKGGNVLYTLTAAECPNVMREIGRLREVSFRDGGGGTGKSIDIDELVEVGGGGTPLLGWAPAPR